MRLLSADKVASRAPRRSSIDYVDVRQMSFVCGVARWRRLMKISSVNKAMEAQPMIRSVADRRRPARDGHWCTGILGNKRNELIGDVFRPAGRRWRNMGGIYWMQLSDRSQVTIKNGKLQDTSFERLADRIAGFHKTVFGISSREQWQSIILRYPGRNIARMNHAVSSWGQSLQTLSTISCFEVCP